jgi:hypothetical protein
MVKKLCISILGIDLKIQNHQLNQSLVVLVKDVEDTYKIFLIASVPSHAR